MTEMVFPDVTIYVRATPGGTLEPLQASVAGFSLPIVHGSINIDPNGSRTGTRAVTATLTVLIGSGSIVEVESRDEIPELAPLEAPGS